jgi:putative transcriptional regulator
MVTVISILALLATIVFAIDRQVTAGADALARREFVATLDRSAALASSRFEPRKFAPYSLASMKANDVGAVLTAGSAFEAGLPARASITRYLELGDQTADPSTVDGQLYELDNPADSTQQHLHVDRIEAAAMINGHESGFCLRLPQVTAAGNKEPQMWLPSSGSPFGTNEYVYVEDVGTPASICGDSIPRSQATACAADGTCPTSPPALTWILKGRDPATNAATVTLTWSPVAGATSYDLFKHLSGSSTRFGPGDAVVGAQHLSDTTIDDTLPLGVAWDYMVRAHFANGYDATTRDSNPATVLVAPQLAPTAPVLTHEWIDRQSDPATARLVWTQTAGATDYQLERQSGATWRSVGSSIANTTGSPSVEDSIAQGTTATYRVQATYDAAYEPAQALSNVETLDPSRVAPDAPVVTGTDTYTPGTGWPATELTWPVVALPGASISYDVERAVVTYSSSGATTIGRWEPLASAVLTPLDVVTLVDQDVSLGDSWCYRVQAVASFPTGSTADSAISGWGVSAPVDFRPASPVLRGSLRGSALTASWDSVAAVASYSLTDTTRNSTVTTSGTTAYVADLPVGGVFTFTAVAQRALPAGKVRRSAPSNPLVVQTGPTIPVLTVGGSGNAGVVDLSWSPVGGAGHLVVQRRSPDSSSWVVLATLNGSATSWSETRPTADQVANANRSYAYQVVALAPTIAYLADAVMATGSRSTVQSAPDTALVRPLPPAGFVATQTSTSASSATLSWLNQNGAAGFNYVLTQTGTDASGLPTETGSVAATPSCSPSACSLGVAGLKAGGTYNWSLTASNVGERKGGVSEPAQASAVLAPSSPTFSVQRPAIYNTTPAAIKEAGGNDLIASFVTVPGATQYTLFHGASATPASDLDDGSSHHAVRPPPTLRPDPCSDLSTFDRLPSQLDGRTVHGKADSWCPSRRARGGARRHRVRPGRDGVGVGHRHRPGGRVAPADPAARDHDPGHGVGPGRPGLRVAAGDDGASRNRVLSRRLPVRGRCDRRDRGGCPGVVRGHGPQRAGPAGRPGRHGHHGRGRGGHPRGRAHCARAADAARPGRRARRRSGADAGRVGRGDLMPIAVDIDVMLARRKMSVGELADRVGITPANLAVLKNGRAKAVRFATLAALCEVLRCQPGDLLRWEAEQAEQAEAAAGG